MHAIMLAVVLAAPAQVKDCPTYAQDAGYMAGRFGRPAPAAVNCPNYTPPVRWYCKRCAGCAGGKCLSCQQPYFGSAPYNYRVQFDYPWSVRPAYPADYYPAEPSGPGEEIPIEPEEIDISTRKPMSLRR